MDTVVAATILILFGIGAGCHILWMLIGRVPTLSSSDEAAETIVELIPENFDGKLVDLGAGWGVLCFSIATRFPAAQIIAVEHSPLPWLLLILQRWVFKARHVKVVHGNLFDQDLRDADIVTVYLLPDMMAAVANKLANELQPGAIVFSNSFTLPYWSWQERHPYGYIPSKRQTVAIYQYEV